MSGPPIGGPGGGGLGDALGGMVNQLQQSVASKPPKIDDNIFKLTVLQMLAKIAEGVGVSLSANDVMPHLGLPPVPGGDGLQGAPGGMLPGGMPPGQGQKVAHFPLGYAGPAPETDTAARARDLNDTLRATVGLLNARRPS